MRSRINVGRTGRPAYAKARFVSESLANYSAMLVTEKFLGPLWDVKTQSATARRLT